LSKWGEIEKHGGIEQFQQVIFTPKAGDAVIFKQNILHEGSLLLSKDKFKFVIKTDIIVEREGSGVGFSPSKEESEDFFACLQLFRQAQQYELSFGADKAKANDCYEKSLSIRYSYPKNNIDMSYNNPVIPVSLSENAPKVGSFNAERSMPKINVNTPWQIFPREVWYTIMLFIGDCKTLQNLCEVFLALVPEMERVLKEILIPKIIYHSGVFTRFKFDYTNIVYENLPECSRLVAMYSMFLLGNSPDSTHYLVNYDKSNKEASTVNLTDLLVATAIEKPVRGTIFKVRQQKEEKEPNKDLYHSVDRQLMTTYFDRDDFGIDIESEERAYVTPIPSFPSDSSDESEEDFNDLFYAQSDLTQARELRVMFNQWDRYYQFCRNDLPRDDSKSPSESDVYDFELGSFEQDEHSKFQSYIFNESEMEVIYSKSCSNAKPAAAIVRKVFEPVYVKSDDYCGCSMVENMSGTLSSHCSSYVFNRVVIDFSTTKLSVTECESELFTSSEISAELLKWVSHFCDLEAHDIKLFSVDISELENVIPSFNHASCQCNYPNYRINDYVNLSSYPFLKSVWVVFVRHKEDTSKSFVFTSYPGIVAL